MAYKKKSNRRNKLNQRKNERFWAKFKKNYKEIRNGR